MNKSFNYYYATTPMGTLSIEDLGNVCINAINDSYDEWYMKIETKDGWVSIDTLGPLKVDSDFIPNYFSYSFNRFEYSDKKVVSIIDKLLNDSKKLITQAVEISEEDYTRRVESLKKRTYE